MTEVFNVSRRGFIKGASAATGGLILGVSLPVFDALGQQVAPAEPGRLNTFVQIGSDGVVTITLHQAEMGQGVQTSLPMIVAEELEADWNKIRVVHASAIPVNGMEPAAMGTGGSRSVRVNFEPLSKAGATARQLMLQAASNRWAVPVSECIARNGVVSHPNGKSATFGELARGAANLVPPQNVALKPASERRLIGKPTTRLDARDHATGKAVFGIDIAVDNMLVGTVVQSPVFGGKLKSLDPAPAMAVRGVNRVIPMDDYFVVVATGFWAARKGAAALKPEWTAGANAKNSSEKIEAAMLAALKQPGAIAVDRGDGKAASKSAKKTVSATYQVPFLHHATMEPMNATAWVHDDKIEVWAPTQNAGRERYSIAEEFNVRPENVNVHVPYMGGGFGRRIGMGFIRPAIVASKAVGRPVKIIWTRQEDMTQGMMRPCAVSKLTAAVNEAGAPLNWENRLVVPSIAEQLTPTRVRNGIDPISVFGADVLRYDIPSQKLEYAMPSAGVPLGFWRSVPHSYNAFFIESFLDEIARETGVDPLVMRRGIMRGYPRHLAVLERAAKEAGWGTPLPAGRGRGIAIHESFGSICAQVVELEMPSPTTVRLLKMTAAVDCGTAINPKGIEAQIEGAMVFALTAAMYGRIDIKDGATVQRDFDTYKMALMQHVPPVSVHIIENGPIGGITEPGVPPLAPALANAIVAAGGKRYRKLPLMDEGIAFA
ncbi:molybdopterin cofactor-binding domain-containing protein [Iodidimonas sp. SYSU 1G8]|uniref:xanthine dehydrogenase family protein molybdopterin-binding subunit n=1 Tax=Iodidimonas sp. SYSU 1G8 TaxID=3133967 RepID=UPI0031FE4621